MSLSKPYRPWSIVRVAVIERLSFRSAGSKPTTLASSRHHHVGRGQGRRGEHGRQRQREAQEQGGSTKHGWGSPSQYWPPAEWRATKWSGPTGTGSALRSPRAR